MKNPTLSGLTLCVALTSSHLLAATTTADWMRDATLSWIPAYAIDGNAALGIPAETKEQHAARRAAIAADVEAAVNDQDTAPLFAGPDGRAKTGLFVLAIWRGESNYDLRVHRHHCKGLPAGSCDSGRAWCMGQLHWDDGVSTLMPKGWTATDLETDVKKCAKATVAVLRYSMKACSHLKGPDQFAAYASGKCIPNDKMRARYEATMAWAKAHPLP